MQYSHCWRKSLDVHQNWAYLCLSEPGGSALFNCQPPGGLGFLLEQPWSVAVMMAIVVSWRLVVPVQVQPNSLTGVLLRYDHTATGVISRLAWARVAWHLTTCIGIYHRTASLPNPTTVPSLHTITSAPFIMKVSLHTATSTITRLTCSLSQLYAWRRGNLAIETFQGNWLNQRDWYYWFILVQLHRSSKCLLKLFNEGEATAK